MIKGKKIILHDLSSEMADELFGNLNDDYIIFDANLSSARCIGCFECWLKKPGVCKFPDRLQSVGSCILSSEKLIIFSTILYGGVSVRIKNILDRSIPGITPFFRKRFGKLHHLQRYKSETEVSVYYYNVKEISQRERQLASEYITAMGINFYSKKNDIHFIEETAFSEVAL